MEVAAPEEKSFPHLTLCMDETNEVLQRVLISEP